MRRLPVQRMIFSLAAILGLVVVAGACAGGGEAIQTRYEVTVQFNTSTTQDDIDEVGALLRTYDDNLDFLIMEIFPPIGRALLATDAPDFCQTIETSLKAKSYIAEVSCGPAPSEEPSNGDTTSGSVAPNTFMTFEGQRYRLVDLEQANLIDQSQFYELGVATKADIDYQDQLKVYRRQGDDAALYTYTPATDVEGEEHDVPALWFRWEPE